MGGELNSIVTILVSWFALTEVIPSNSPSSRSMVLVQCPQVMFGTLMVLVVIFITLIKRDSKKIQNVK